mmetsp:Transcript_111785/g.316490  ORF Transcript_111785/g.316490 Transcript_111785/m.316490 type:complete len:214 (-) Transcript_111785:257-898(-)
MLQVFLDLRDGAAVLQHRRGDAAEGGGGGLPRQAVAVREALLDDLADVLRRHLWPEAPERAQGGVAGRRVAEPLRDVRRLVHAPLAHGPEGLARGGRQDGRLAAEVLRDGADLALHAEGAQGDHGGHPHGLGLVLQACGDGVLVPQRLVAEGAERARRSRADALVVGGEASRYVADVRGALRTHVSEALARRGHNLRLWMVQHRRNLGAIAVH